MLKAIDWLIIVICYALMVLILIFPGAFPLLWYTSKTPRHPTDYQFLKITYASGIMSVLVLYIRWDAQIAWWPALALLVAIGVTGTIMADRHEQRLMH